MFDFINENIPEELKTIFVINRSIHSYQTCSSLAVHIPKAKTSIFGLNTLRYDDANLWNKFLLCVYCYIKNLIWQKQSLKSYSKCISWTLVVNKFLSIFVCFVSFNSTAAKIRLSK